MDGHLAKPIDAARLYAVIAEAPAARNVDTEVARTRVSG
jgi:hypothetical protein